MKSLRLPLVLAICGLLIIFCFQKEENSEASASNSAVEQDAKETANSMSATSNSSFFKKSLSTLRTSFKALTQTPTPVAPPPTQNSVAKDTSNSALQTPVDTDDFGLNRDPLSSVEIQSVTDLTKALSESIAKSLTSHQFMQLINDSLQLKPQFIDEGTSAIGSMVTVRTRNSLQGTRYLHTQFMGEKNQADFLQHASFQVRPGPDSFNHAVAALNQVLPKTSKAKEVTNDYVLYSTGDGYVAWVKVADLDDLKSNDLNSASSKDIGTVIVTIEQDIHGDDEH